MFDVYQKSRRVETGGLSILTTDHGPADGPVVLMIHGWPDTARLWRHQVPVLVDNGYRVLAPDVRGMGGSDRPGKVDDYRVSASVTDMISLLDDIGAERAHVVGHDSGAVAAWGLAISAPHRVASLTALSAGHPNAFNQAGLEQMRWSWYMLLFQFEGTAEGWLSQNDWAMFRRLMGNHPETENWIENLAPEGALTASLNWYRANAHPSQLVRPRRLVPPSTVPTLGVWSSGDLALTEKQMERSGEFVDAEWRYERIEGASHWIPLDAPDRLNELLLTWLGANS